MPYEEMYTLLILLMHFSFSVKRMLFLLPKHMIGYISVQAVQLYL